MDGRDNARYWMRTTPAKGCSPNSWNTTFPNPRTGVVVYNDKSGTPIDYAPTFNPKCQDEPYDKLVPTLPWTIGPPSNIAADSQFDIGLDTITAGSLFPANITRGRWNMYSDTMWLNYSNATITQNLSAPQNSFNTHSVVLKQDSEADRWVYFLISGTGVPSPCTSRGYIPIAHPIHLHGHDFAILQQSDKSYAIGGLNLNLKNPPRRDVALMPASGFLVLAFKADNPGIWLMHCMLTSWHLL